MPKDPIGILGRMNAASLMMITPEFFKVRRLRTKGAAKISETPARFRNETGTHDLGRCGYPLCEGWQSERSNCAFSEPTTAKHPTAMIRFGTLLRLTLIWSLSICRDLAAAQVT